MKRKAVPGKFQPKGLSGTARRVRIGWAEAAKFAVPIPKQEKKRLAALHRYQILDTPPEEDFDCVTTLAAQICETPIALLSLVDSHRQWFKSKVGISLCETSRDIAFCAYTILHRDLFIVEDAAADPRFASNPLVTREPKIRFYAGAPLLTSNHLALGALCVIDRVSRKLTGEQAEALRALSRLVMAQLELRRITIQLKGELRDQRLERQRLQKALLRAEAANRLQGNNLRNSHR